MSQNQQLNEKDFWDKVWQNAGQLGGGLLEQILTLYFALVDDDTPLWAKGIIVGALIYLISPVDAIPDFIPVAGFTDDAGLIAGALGAIAVIIKPEHKESAKQQVKSIFG